MQLALLPATPTQLFRARSLLQFKLSTDTDILFSTVGCPSSIDYICNLQHMKIDVPIQICVSESSESVLFNPRTQKRFKSHPYHDDYDHQSVLECISSVFKTMDVRVHGTVGIASHAALLDCESQR
jgi:hypothetical protein